MSCTHNPFPPPHFSRIRIDPSLTTVIIIRSSQKTPHPHHTTTCLSPPATHRKDHREIRASQARSRSSPSTSSSSVLYGPVPGGGAGLALTALGPFNSLATFRPAAAAAAAEDARKGPRPFYDCALNSPGRPRASWATTKRPGRGD